MMRRPFRSLFCERFDCAPSEYEDRALTKCLYWHARFLAPLIRMLSPDFFRIDLKFIRYLGESTGMREALEDRGNLRHANRSNPGFFRTTCRIRVSGSRATRLAETLFEHDRERSPDARDD